jgi:hypothetical protein
MGWRAASDEELSTLLSPALWCYRRATGTSTRPHAGMGWRALGGVTSSLGKAQSASSAIRFPVPNFTRPLAGMAGQRAGVGRRMRMSRVFRIVVMCVCVLCVLCVCACLRDGFRNRSQTHSNEMTQG